MLSLARHLDLDEEQTRLAGIGGLMHDLGKAAMPLEVLNKPGKHHRCRVRHHEAPPCGGRKDAARRRGRARGGGHCPAPSREDRRNRLPGSLGR
nr:hypothetical protein [Aeromonas sp. QDB66]